MPSTDSTQSSTKPGTAHQTELHAGLGSLPGLSVETSTSNKALEPSLKSIPVLVCTFRHVEFFSGKLITYLTYKKKITCNIHDVCPNGMEYCRECLEVFNSKYFLNVFSVSYTEHYPNYKELVQRQTQVVLSIQIVLKESCSLNVNQPLSIGKKQFL